ncbi:hypothetical protein ES703_56292 [subsurface metagenome]
MFVKVSVYLSAPLLGYGLVALGPALGAVDLVDDKPEEQCPAVSPAGDYVPVELLLVFPCLVISIKVNGAANELVRIVSIPCVSTPPDSHGKIGVEPDIPANVHVSFLTPFKELVQTAAAVLVVPSQAGAHRFQRSREKADEICPSLLQIIKSIFCEPTLIKQLIAVVIPHANTVK